MTKTVEELTKECYQDKQFKHHYFSEIYEFAEFARRIPDEGTMVMLRDVQDRSLKRVCFEYFFDMREVEGEIK